MKKKRLLFSRCVSDICDNDRSGLFWSNEGESTGRKRRRAADRRDPIRRDDDRRSDRGYGGGRNI